jgi:hypothetical protein
VEMEPTGAQQEAISAVVASTMALTALDGDKTQWEKFSGGLANAMAIRISNETATSTGSTYFCFVERPNQFSGLVGAASFFDLDVDSSVPIAGKLLLVSENANGGIAFDVQSQAEMLAKLAELSLGSAPAAAYYPSPAHIRFYPAGFNDVASQFSLGLHPPRVTLTEHDIKEVIDLFNAESLCTPQHTAPLFWEDSAKWVPHGLAEKNIQWPLKMALVFGFQNTAVVVPEEPNSVGDADFTLYGKGNPVEDPPVAIVEVKVQKSARTSGDVSPSETCKEFLRGLIQTASYRNQTGAGIGMLACFDLRKPGTGSDAAWDTARARASRVFKRLDKVANGRPTVVSWMSFADTQSAQAAGTGSLRVEDELYPVTKRPDIKAMMTA